MKLERLNPFPFAALLAAVVFCALPAGPLTAESDKDTETSEKSWQCMTRRLWGQIPEYRDSWSGNRRCGGLALAPKTGRLYLGVNDKYGVYVSDDQGKSFTRLDDGQLQGRWVTPSAMQIDPERPDALVVFKVGRSSGMTLDGGRTWTKFTNKGKDGWGFGMVDLTGGEPREVLAHQHHSQDYWYSQDAGQSWKKVENTEDCVGIALAGKAVYCSRRNRGVFRSEDLGRTWKKVSSAATVTKTPRTFGEHLYWPVKNGLVVSRDSGRSWQFCGGKLENILAGPCFGNSEEHMMVMTEEGFFETADGGKTWKKRMDFFTTPKSYKHKKDLHDFAWDPNLDLLYVCGLGGEAWKAQLED